MLQSAYVLHTRAYRDTSLLLELFTPDHGRVSVIARGARGARSRSSRFKGALQPFAPLLVSWYGKTELFILTAAEAEGMVYNLSGEALICGIYLNELLMRLLHRYDAHPQLYGAYQNALLALQQKENTQLTLRLFEKCLLLELGYALQLDREVHTGEEIAADQYYYFDSAQGYLQRADEFQSSAASHIFCGKSLLALHHDQLTEENFLRDAKRLLRIALARLLENRPIRSRELFLVKD